jgi:hypothetical protein
MKPFPFPKVKHTNSFAFFIRRSVFDKKQERYGMSKMTVEIYKSEMILWLLKLRKWEKASHDEINDLPIAAFFRQTDQTRSARRTKTPIYAKSEFCTLQILFYTRHRSVDVLQKCTGVV